LTDCARHVAFGGFSSATF